MMIQNEYFKNEPQEDFSDAGVIARIDNGIKLFRSSWVGITKPYPVIVGGEREHTDNYIDVYDPAHRFHLLGRVCIATPDLVRRACAGADSAFQKDLEYFWDNFKAWIAGRKRVMRKALELIREERYTIAPLIACEVSKSLKGAFGEIEEALDFGEYYLLQVDNLFVRVRTRPDLRTEENVRVAVPRGSTEGIGVFNFPFSLSFEKICASYLAGCPALFKSAEQAPITGYYLVDLLLRAGMEPDYIAYLPGYGDIGGLLVTDAAIAQICFTGSMEVGHIINTEAAIAVAGNPSSYPCGIKRIEPELGANNPMIITRSANIDDTVKAILSSKWNHQGEKCSALQRVFIVAPPEHEFSKTLLSRVIAGVSSFEYGHPVWGKKKYNYNAVIDRHAFDRIKNRINECKKIKEPLLEVDLSDHEEDGYFIGPSIHDGIPHDSPLVGEEVFGPMLFVFFTDTLEEAIRLANVYPHITAGIFTQSEKEKKQFIRGMAIGRKSGLIYVNREIVGAVAGQHQFGPINQSGSGYKLATPNRMRNFINEVGICENHMSQGVLFKDK